MHKIMFKAMYVCLFAVFDGYDQMTDSSPYSVNGAGGLSPATAFSQSHLEV